MKLESITLVPSTLSSHQRREMLDLMQCHYDGVTEQQFFDDLNEKDWVILLSHDSKLCGFSTQQVFDFESSGKKVKILFSGDTIIDQNHWGSMALPVAWGRLMLSIIAEEPDTPLYWLLTTKGYKTYRFLSVFFLDFQPRYDAIPSLFVQALLEGVAQHQFSNRFDSTTGILRAEHNGQRLQRGLAEINDKRLRDPHVRYFQKRNPLHMRGDELVCLARCHPDNLTPYILKQL